MKSKNNSLTNLLLSAMFLSIGLLLPFLTGQVQQIGNMLLPMHIPVILCSLICSWQYGLAVGIILPLMRSLLFTMPVLYPSAIAMSFELATYGFLTGFLFYNSRWQCVRSLYRSLIITMVCGRVVWGIAMMLLLGVKSEVFTFTAFLSGAVINAVPGIILQLVIIPAVMLILDRTHLKPFKKNSNKRVSLHE